MKYVLILLLLPIQLFAQTCWVQSSQEGEEDIKQCKDGQQLHLSILYKEKEMAKATLLGHRASFCDLRYNAYIDDVEGGKIYTLTCIFKNQLQK